MPRRRTRRTPPIKPEPREPVAARDGYIALGLVVRPHGLGGELRVEAFAPGAPNLQPGRTVELHGKPFHISGLREVTGAWLLTLEGIATRNMAEDLRGALIEAEESTIERASPDSYFLHELIGMRVTTQGEELGEVTEVLQPGANDVYVVRTGGGEEVLVPAIEGVVLRIDLETRTMDVELPPGLL